MKKTFKPSVFPPAVVFALMALNAFAGTDADEDTARSIGHDVLNPGISLRISDRNIKLDQLLMKISDAADSEVELDFDTEAIILNVDIRNALDSISANIVDPRDYYLNIMSFKALNKTELQQ